jgi:hypothetical protein
MGLRSRRESRLIYSITLMLLYGELQPRIVLSLTLRKSKSVLCPSSTIVRELEMLLSL